MEVPGIAGVKDNGDSISCPLSGRVAEKGAAKRIDLPCLSIRPRGENTPASRPRGGFYLNLYHGGSDLSLVSAPVSSIGIDDNHTYLQSHSYSAGNGKQIK
jgi:hypothetical protein